MAVRDPRKAAARAGLPTRVTLRISRALMCCAGLLLPAMAVMAQTPATGRAMPALSPAQQTQQARQDAEMTRAGLNAARLIDAGRAAEVWDGASTVARRAVARDAFVTQVAADRARLGELASRGHPSLTRVQYAAAGALPEGLYINVSFPTRFANSARPVRELVSFRLDEDRVWRVSGYSVRAAGN